ncbi:hypothetical protein KA005_70510 [bacterium]|nr:hypothetical protein [bacterium]
MKCPDVSDEIKEKMEKKDTKFNGIIILDPPTGEALGLSDEVLVTLNDIKFGPLPEHGSFFTSTRPESEIILSIKVVNANEEGTSVDQKTNLGEIKYVADYDTLNIHHQVIFQGKLNSPALQFEIDILEADVKKSKDVKELVGKSLAAVATVPGIAPYKDMVSALPDLVNSVIALNVDDQVLNYKFSLFTKPIVVEEDEFQLREGTYTIRKVWDNTERDVYSVCLEINVMKILQNER